MKKISSILFFFVLTVIFVSCEMPDYSDEIQETYQQAKGDHNPISPEPEPTEQEKEEEETEPENIIIDGNMWSALHQSLKWEEAFTYCENLTELGYSDWRLPTVDELRTLIQNCNGNNSEGLCEITDDCILNRSGCGNNDAENCRCCATTSDGKYSKIGDTCSLWSSLPAKNTYPEKAWIGSFSSGCITTRDIDTDAANVRCVR